MRLPALLAAAALLGFTFAPVIGCQVALRAEGEDPHCSVEGADCGDGRTCQQGVCRPPPVCEYVGPEKCNGRDDDCDGEIDNGFDKDGDGYTTCGEAGKIDCDDEPETGKGIHPGVPELCNGYDDNCNGKTDEEPNDCTAKGMECWSDRGICTVRGDCRLHGCTSGGCDPKTGLCTSPDCRSTKVCPPSQTCDLKSGLCVQPTNPGDPCDVSTPCKPGYGCIDLNPLDLGRTGSICTKSCCESTDCDPGFACKTGKTGASLCMKVADGVATGALLGAAKCTGGGDCRSGICTGGFCQDGCCGSPACGSGGGCGVKLFSDNTFLCRGSPTGKGFGATCSADTDCQSGWCNDKLFGVGPGLCTKKCCRSEDCAPGQRCATYTVSGTTTLSACVFSDTSVGSKHAGEACEADGECRSSRCLDKQCYDNCCRDSDCFNDTVCRPRGIGSGAYPLRCIRK